MGYPWYTVKSHTPPDAPSPVGQVEDQKGNVRKLMGITLYSNSHPQHPCVIDTILVTNPKQGITQATMKEN